MFLYLLDVRYLINEITKTKINKFLTRNYWSGFLFNKQTLLQNGGQSYKMSVNMSIFNIFSADITLCRVTKVKVFFLVLVYVLILTYVDENLWGVQSENIVFKLFFRRADKGLRQIWEELEKFIFVCFYRWRNHSLCTLSSSFSSSNNDNTRNKCFFFIIPWFN